MWITIENVKDFKREDKWLAAHLFVKSFAFEEDPGDGTWVDWSQSVTIRPEETVTSVLKKMAAEQKVAIDCVALDIFTA